MATLGWPQSARLNRTRSACSICTETCGSGSKTATVLTTKTARSFLRRTAARRCFAEAASTAFLILLVHLIATGERQRRATIAMAFELLDHFRGEPCLAADRGK